MKRLSLLGTVFIVLFVALSAIATEYGDIVI